MPLILDVPRLSPKSFMFPKLSVLTKYNWYKFCRSERLILLRGAPHSVALADKNCAFTKLVILDRPIRNRGLSSIHSAEYEVTLNVTLSENGATLLLLISFIVMCHNGRALVLSMPPLGWGNIEYMLAAILSPGRILKLLIETKVFGYSS